MRRIAALAFLVAAGIGACFEDTNPVDETGAMQSSGQECILGTEGCPCIEGGCVGDLECLSNVCVDAGGTSEASGATSSNPTTSVGATSLDEGPVMEEGPVVDEGPVTTDVGGGLPQGAPCDPFLDLCEPGLACVGVDETGFFCELPGPFGPFEPCEGSTCGPGLLCVQAEGIDACVAQGLAGCCTFLCNVVDGGFECPPELVCEPFYPAMSAPPGYDHVGICVSNPG